MTDLHKGLEPNARQDLDLVAHSQALSLKRIADALEALVAQDQIHEAVVELADKVSKRFEPGTEPLNEAEFNRPFVVVESSTVDFNDPWAVRVLP